VNENNASWNVMVKRMLKQNLDEQSLQRMVSGKKNDDGIAILNNEIPHYRSAEFTRHTHVFERLPFFPERIFFIEVYLDEG
jgi:hypothetical protein